MNIWEEVLEELRPSVDGEDFRRWFSTSAYASDAGDHITVWVPTEAVRRHLILHYEDAIERALDAIGRRHTHVRFVVTGVDEDEEE